jgi:fatty acid desaturase
MYAQHAGCEPRSSNHPHRHSNNFLNRFFNLTMFNIGYHIEHHERGYVHWADLPALHARLKPELVADGAHVLTIGYYRGGRLLGRSQRRPDWLARFLGEQHPDYALKEDHDASKAATNADRHASAHSVAETRSGA